MAATHTIEGYLAVEVAPRAFVVENGDMITRSSATKWCPPTGLEILEYEGAATIEVTDEQRAQAEEYSADELARIAAL